MKLEIGAYLATRREPEAKAAQSREFERCLHHLIEEQVRRSPDDVALSFEDCTLSYRELEERANQCARYLQRMGAGPDRIVAVLMDRSVEMVVALLGTLKAGAAYLPLDPGYPAARLEFLLKDSAAVAVLTQQAHAGKIAAFGGTVLSLDTEVSRLNMYPRSAPETSVGPKDLAYVIYTSGSTGAPKGCMISHRAINNRLLWMQREYQLGARDRVLQKTPYTFDVSVWEFFWPLLAGARLVVAKPEGHKDAQYLARLIQREQVTVCHFVPSMLRVFLNARAARDCGSLRCVFASGEALPYELVREFLHTMPGELHNLYGPTEAAVDVTYWRCEERADKKVPIGRAIDNIQLHVLDEQLRAVPQGQEGELYIGGVGVARGYLNRPELTRERFVPDAFSADPEARLYKTGDRVTVLPDGTLDYLGRMDFQVKLRGFRIELGEIEALLRTHDAVADAVVLVKDQEKGDPKLIAYVSLADDTASPEDAIQQSLRRFCKDRLPEYMVPNHVMTLAQLPLSPHGKVDRNALPWPLRQEQSAKTLDVPPKRASSETSKAELARKIADELLVEARALVEIDGLQASDDMFERGATSLTMAQLVESVQRRYSVAVPVEVILDSPTVQAIADCVAGELATRGASLTTEPDVNAETGMEPVALPVAEGSLTLPTVEFRASAYREATVAEGFGKTPLQLSQLGSLLSILQRKSFNGRSKYVYASSGGKLAVQTYLYVKEGAIEALRGGVYYYHPEANGLYLLRAGLDLDRAAFAEYSRTLFDRAAVGIFLVAQMGAIEPTYGGASHPLVVMDAGYQAQLLVQRQRAAGISIAPVLGVDFARIAESFRLGGGHRFIHCLLCGSSSENVGATAGIERGGSLTAHFSDPNGEGSFADFLDVAQLTRSARPVAPRSAVRNFPPSEELIPLANNELEQADYYLPACNREFSQDWIELRDLSSLLTLLRDVNGVGRLSPGLVGSAHLGVYLYVKAGRIEGVPEGMYRYDSDAHRLVLCRARPSVDPKACYTPANREHYAQAAFCLFFIGRRQMLEASYGSEGRYVALLQSGYLGQLLLDRKCEFSIGICPIGAMRFDKLRNDFGVSADDELLQSFVCGRFVTEIPKRYSRLLAHSVAKETVEPESRDLAIIGLTARLPGAGNLQEFWDNLRQGRSGIGDLSPKRRQLWAERGGEMNAGEYRAGFIEEIDSFDSLLFGITPVEARYLDPQERLFLEIAWECLENAGYTADALRKHSARVGVFVGAMWSDYQNQRAVVPSNSGATFPAAFHSSIANRVSHFFDFNGPSIAVDSSCSSAISAISAATESLLKGACDVALVGAVNVMSHPYHRDFLAAANMLSRDGECRPFSARASGWIAGEGVGALLLKRRASAERDGDHIHGIVKSASIGHTGRAGRYGMPSASMQAASMERAIAEAGVPKESIRYIEAAAPGAGMADSAEVEAIKKVFANDDQDARYIGTVKGNIGHLESASAISQIAKVLLQFKHGQLAPTLNFQPLNPLIQLEGSGWSIVGSAVPWDRPSSHGPRRALINAFGATGSSAHVVLEEYSGSSSSGVDRGQPELVLLSAATEEQVHELAGRLSRHLTELDAVTLRDIAFTLRQGRVHHACRIAIVAESVAHLRDTLANITSGSDDAPNVYRGKAARRPNAELTSSQQDLHGLATCWVAGGELPSEGWAGARRVPLPTYPFQKAHHWINKIEAVPTHAEARPSAQDAELLEQTISHVRNLVAMITEIPFESIDPAQPLVEFGFTSLMIVQLNEALERDLGALPKTLYFQCRTIQSLAAYLCEARSDRLRALLRVPATTAAAREPIEARSRARANVQEARKEDEDVAIIGVAGRYPKANTLEQFWANLRDGVDCVSEVPATRWDVAAYYSADAQTSGTTYTKWGGFIDDADRFDAEFFRISGRDAEVMDPQERLFLQTSWAAIEDAGYNPAALEAASAGAVGVFVGVMYGEYQLYQGSGTYGSIAHRVSYALDLHGPSMAVDTLCSSSLTAIHLAVESIKRGEVVAAVAGGVNLSIHPSKYITISQYGMAAPSGRCRSFGADADGFVPAEGVGAVLLKSLSKAVEDGDHIYGVIRASAINHGGKTNGYTVPDPQAQAAVISAALRRAQVDPSTISYLEAHGTGTPLGDPIELAGLATAFATADVDDFVCAVGSVKSNLGHCEAAAGVAGLTKVLLQIEHRQLAPSIHAQALNPNIDFANGRFAVQRSLGEWRRPVLSLNGVEREYPRRAGISSFGAGGANAHLIVEEYGAEESERALSEELGSSPQLLVLSALNGDRLGVYARSLLEWLEGVAGANATSESQLLRRVAYTLQTGRAPMKERLAFTASTIGEAVRKIAAFLRGDADVAGLWRGNVARPGSEISSESIAAGAELDEIAARWVRGEAVHWLKLYGARRPTRIRLPTYPFAGERYWIEARATTVPSRNVAKDSNVRATEQAAQPERTPLFGKDGQFSEPSALLFNEHWLPSDLTRADGTTALNTVAILAPPDLELEIVRCLAELAPAAKVAFVRCQRQIAATVESYVQEFERIQREHARIDAIWDLRGALPGTGQTQRSVLSLLRALTRSQLKGTKALLAVESRSDRERCYHNAWMAYERTVPRIRPDVQFAVVEDCSRRQSVSQWLSLLISESQPEKLESARYIEGRRHVRRLRALDAGRDIGGEPALRANGTYLITGGLGGLGYLLAQHLASKFSARLILTGRSNLDDAGREKLRTLESLGGRAMYVTADVTDGPRMQGAVAQGQSAFGSIHGVFHAAGIAADGAGTGDSVEQAEAVLAPKVTGALVLSEVCKAIELDFICYFSSSAALLGDFGYGDYAAANRFLLALAESQAQRAIAVCWPAWADGGMQFKDAEAARLYLQTTGQRTLSTQAGMQLLEELLARRQSKELKHALVMVGQRDRIERLLGVSASEAATAQPIQISSATVAPKVLADLKQQASEQLKVPEERLHADENLGEFGFDSIGLARFAKQLSARYEIELSPSVFFSHTTLRKLASHLLAEHAEALSRRYGDRVEVATPASVSAESAPKASASAEQTPSDLADPIAIVGMSGRFPQARNVQELWEILSSGRSAVTEIPLERFDWREFFQEQRAGERPVAVEPGKTNSKWLGVVPGVDEFDAGFFDVSPREAEVMDPRQRLLLQESYKALEDAGYGAVNRNGRRVGMFVGVEQGDYQLLVAESGVDSSVVSNHDAILASRLSYFLDLRGPVMAINTACSSSLVAVHQACLSLRSGDCEVAIAAGVNLLLAPQMYVWMSQAGMLSPDGKCYAFDRRANGMVPGEAAVAVVLKRLSQARADGDEIYGVIRGSGINYDGRTNGVTAPNGAAQTELIRDVHARAGIDPANIEYIVTHGTGTRLGDPVEINALNDAFKTVSTSSPSCALTSTKSNVGHTFAASGLVSLVSLLLSMHHETIPASLHADQLSEYIEWRRSPFYVNTRNRAWPRQPGRRRLGAVSAFGMSGTNAHILVESYDEPSRATDDQAPAHLLVLSAKTEAALQERVRELADLMATDTPFTMSSLSHTLLVHRQHFNHRWAVAVQSREQAIRLLRQFGESEKPQYSLVPREFTEQVLLRDYAEDVLAKLPAWRGDPERYRQALASLAELYSQGYSLSWARLFGDEPPARVAVPTYPFLRKRFWIPRRAPAANKESESMPIAPLKPLASPAAAPSPTVAVASEATRAPPAAPKQRQGGNLENELCEMLAAALYVDAAEIDRDCPFSELGLDSIIGVEWVRAIVNRYGVTITATSIYEHGTVRHFAKYLETQLAEGSVTTEATSAAPEIRPPVVEAPKAPALEPPAPAPVASNDIKRLDTLEQELLASLAEALFIEPRDLDLDMAFSELGVDSIIGVEWVKTINDRYGIKLAAARLFDYPNIAALAEYLRTELDGGRADTDQPAVEIATPEPPKANGLLAPLESFQARADAPARDVPLQPLSEVKADPVVVSHTAPPPMPADSALDNAIAIIGVSGAFPRAKDPDEFWNNIAAGRDCITEIPPERWAIDAYYDADQNAVGKTYNKWMGAMDSAAEFDPLFFSISPLEAVWMDPQQRLFLEHCWRCLEDAGLSPSALSGARCGVYVGCTPGDYGQHNEDNGYTAKGLLGNSSAILSARVAYFLNLKGPCLAIDTACSSSLVATAEACDSLLLGRSDLALAGGVSVLAGPGMHIMAGNAGMLSKSGRCYTFDERADGFVPGEAVGVVLLKRLADAIRDEDNIRGIIRGWGVNQDGRTNGITAPSVVAQEELEREVYQRARINPESISLVEAHGTGTFLGDPIEVEALTRAFRGFTQKEGFCAIGSVKSNIGHTLAASGVCSIVKVVKALEHRQLPPTIQFSTLNKHVSLDRSPFFVNRSLQPWNVPAEQPRRAAVSSFGFSGTNAHFVIEEYVPARHADLTRPQCSASRPALIVLSAKNEDRLADQARHLSNAIAGKSASLNLADIAYTLQVGRDSMKRRLAFTAATLEELLEKLTCFVSGAANASLFRGVVKRVPAANAAQSTDHEQTERCIASGDYEKLLQSWVQGADVDWSRLYGPRSLYMTAKPKRISLPSYAFDRKRYWFGSSGRTQEKPRAPIAVVHSVDRRGSLAAEVEPAKPKRPAMYEEMAPVAVGGGAVRAYRPDTEVFAEAAIPRQAPSTAHTAEEQKIAIIGITGRFPQANSVETFWDNLHTGRDCVTEVPLARWDHSQYFDPEKGKPGKSYGKWGGFIDLELPGEVPETSAPTREAQVFTHLVDELLTRTGFTKPTLRRRFENNVGVYLGAMTGGVGDDWPASAIANGLSGELGLAGPSMAIDTMSASSLTALHMACEALKRGDCKAAIVGGIHILQASVYQVLSKMSVLGSNASSRSFSGDGFIPAEAMVAVMVVPLADALAQGDDVLAVIDATAISHSGSTKPSLRSLARSIADTFDRSGISPHSISYVEAGANGSPITDAVEVMALTKVFRDAGVPVGSCQIGSVKSNIGHAVGASGLTQLAKTVMQLKHSALAPTLVTRSINEGIDFARSPFSLCTRSVPWPEQTSDADMKRAFINSPGAGGCYVHVILEQAPQARD